MKLNNTLGKIENPFMRASWGRKAYMVTGMDHKAQNAMFAYPRPMRRPIDRVPNVIGLYFEKPTSRRPLDHLLLWFMTSMMLMGAYPKNAGLSGLQNMDFHPSQCNMKLVK